VANQYSTACDLSIHEEGLVNYCSYSSTLTDVY